MLKVHRYERFSCPPTVLNDERTYGISYKMHLAYAKSPSPDYSNEYSNEYSNIILIPYSNIHSVEESVDKFGRDDFPSTPLVTFKRAIIYFKQLILNPHQLPQKIGVLVFETVDEIEKMLEKENERRE